MLQALDDANKEEEMKYVYLQALRDNYFVPWVKGSRLADFRGYSLPVAKVALNNILTAMKDGKLALFNLHIAVCDAPELEVWTSPEVENVAINDINYNNICNYIFLIVYILSLKLFLCIYLFQFHSHYLCTISSF